MSGYRIMLTEKIRRKPLRDIISYIEAIQSYEHDWGLLITEEFGWDLERSMLTSVPASIGGFNVIELLLDEEALLEAVESRGLPRDTIARLLGRGWPLHRLIGERNLGKIVEEDPEMLSEVLAEIVVPLRYSREALEGIGNLGRRSEILSLASTRSFLLLVEPSKVMEVLEESNTVKDLMEGLKGIWGSASEFEGLVASMVFYFPAHRTLEELEMWVAKMLGALRPWIVEDAMLYNKEIRSHGGG